MTDPTDPDLVFDLDTVRMAAASGDSGPVVGAMLTSMADALESLRERYRMAEVIADIARLKIRADDTPVPLKTGDKMPIILSWVCRTLAMCLETKGAPNYFGWGWTDEATGKSYRVRVQHEHGKSPECVAADARDERDLYRAERDEAVAALASERGEGNGPGQGGWWYDDNACVWLFGVDQDGNRAANWSEVERSGHRWKYRVHDAAGMLVGSEPTAHAAMRYANGVRGAA